MKFASDIYKILITKISKVLWFLGYNAFLFILIFILADFIIGGLIFYQYIYLAEKEKPLVAGTIIKFDDKTYSKIIINNSKY